MATTARHRRLEPCYKQHTAVDDVKGVVLDVAVTTGAVNEGETIEAQVDHVREVSGREIAAVTAAAGYAYAKVYAALERRGIDPVIPRGTPRCISASASRPSLSDRSITSPTAPKCGRFPNTGDSTCLIVHSTQ